MISSPSPQVLCTSWDTTLTSKDGQSVTAPSLVWLHFQICIMAEPSILLALLRTDGEESLGFRVRQPWAGYPPQ